MLLQTEIDEFIKIIQKDYGINLTRDQAVEQATNLVLLFETVLRKKLDNFCEKDQQLK